MPVIAIAVIWREKGRGLRTQKSSCLGRQGDLVMTIS
jgi:hypothetical protein